MIITVKFIFNLVIRDYVVLTLLLDSYIMSSPKIQEKFILLLLLLVVVVVVVVSHKESELVAQLEYLGILDS